MTVAYASNLTIVKATIERQSLSKSSYDSLFSSLFFFLFFFSKSKKFLRPEKIVFCVCKKISSEKKLPRKIENFLSLEKKTRKKKKGRKTVLICSLFIGYPERLKI